MDGSCSCLYRGVAQLVARTVRDREAAGSNPVAPTIFSVLRHPHGAFFCYYISMKRYILILAAFLITLCSAPVCAQSLFGTYEINIIPGLPPKPGDAPQQRESNKCHAVRLNKEWFITAAHCVQGDCVWGCTLQVRLIVGQGHELVMQTYSASNSSEKVKIYNSYSVDKNNIANDIALLKFPEDKEKTNLVYLLDQYSLDDRNKKLFMESSGLSESAIEAAANGSGFPNILILNTQTAKILNRMLMVPSISGKDAKVLKSHDLVFFSPKNQYIFTSNFGIVQGVSGSGVFTATGELVGIVSTMGQLYRGAENNLAYTFLTVFDNNAFSFIKKHAGVQRPKETAETDISYFKVIPEDQRELIFAIENAVK